MENILDKDADDISDEEYNMIAEYIIKNGDADILEEILVDCYTIKKSKNGERNPVVLIMVLKERQKSIGTL